MKLARHALAPFVLSLALAGSQNATAQGCAQCKDNLRSMPPRVQSAYRDAIAILIGAALSVIAGTVVVARRSR